MDLVLHEIFISTLESSPLTMDYSPKEAQGKAYALNSLGMNLGVILGVGGFVSLIKYLDLQ